MQLQLVDTILFQQVAASVWLPEENSPLSEGHPLCAPCCTYCHTVPWLLCHGLLTSAPEGLPLTGAGVGCSCSWPCPSLISHYPNSCWLLAALLVTLEEASPVKETALYAATLLFTVECASSDLMASTSDC